MQLTFGVLNVVSYTVYVEQMLSRVPTHRLWLLYVTGVGGVGDAEFMT